MGGEGFAPRELGRPSDSALVFPTNTGEAWTDVHFRNWRRRRFGKATREIGMDGSRPYDLRHSFASLLLAEQTNHAEIAETMGHSLQTFFSTYAHVIDEVRGRDPIRAEDEIRKARAAAAKSYVAQVLPDARRKTVGGTSQGIKKPGL